MAFAQHIITALSEKLPEKFSAEANESLTTKNWNFHEELSIE